MAEWLVALIAAGGAILGTVASGIITYKVTARQVSEARQQAQEALAHATRESWIQRQVEARRLWIYPLREALADAVVARSLTSQRFGMVRSAVESGDDSEAKRVLDAMEAVEQGGTDKPYASLNFARFRCGIAAAG
jgi:hypothetical protein